jgi:endonuclease YncB( thermonuclease family)
MKLSCRSSLILMALVAIASLITPLVKAAPLDGYDLPDGAVEARFVKVIDGDTFIAELGENGQWPEETIRMIGIDTPEISYSYGNEPECYGKEATRFADSILNAAPRIWLEEDRRDTDDFGRLLRYVWYEDPASGNIFMLNEELVYNGYALAKDYRPNTTRQDVLDDAEDHAITESYGMWMECDRTVSGNPDLEDESGPSTAEPTPGGEGAVEEDVFCAVFDNFQDAQDFLAEFPEIAEYIEIDGDGNACEDWFP